MFCPPLTIFPYFNLNFCIVTFKGEKNKLAKIYRLFFLKKGKIDHFSMKFYGHKNEMNE